MKIQFKAICAGLLFATFSAGAAAPGEAGDLVDLHTVTEITTSTATVSAGLSGLSASARASGVHNVFLLGAIKKKPAGDQVGFYISWDTMEMQVSGRGLIAPIAAPLHSKFNGPATIDVGTDLTALGSLAALGVAFADLQAQQRELEDGAITSLDVEENHKVSQGSDQSPRIGTTGAKTGGEDDGYDLTSFKKSGENTVREVDCNNRVDFAADAVFRQTRKETVNYDGEIVSPGKCEDVGEPMTIFNDYPDRCGYDYDPTKDKIFQTAIKSFMDDGATKWLTNCLIVSDEADAVSFDVTHVPCTRDDNFLSGYSELQEKIIADVGDGRGNHIFVPCHGTGTRFTHKDEPCAVGYSDKGVPYARHTVSIVVDGKTETVKECTLDSSESPFREVLCAKGNRYEHLLDQGYSHPKMKIVDGDENLVRGCEAKTTIRYPITVDLDACTVEQDDERRELVTYGRRSIIGFAGKIEWIDKKCEVQARTHYANGVVDWEISSTWVELKPTRNIEGGRGWFSHKVEGVDLSTPEDFKYEYYSKKDNSVPASRTNASVPLGCYYLNYETPVWDSIYSSGDRSEQNWDFSSDWRTCDLNLGADPTRDHAPVGGYAKLGSFEFVETTARGDGTTMKRCSTSNSLVNVLGGVVPGHMSMVSDFKDCEK